MKACNIKNKLNDFIYFLSIVIHVKKDYIPLSFLSSIFFSFQPFLNIIMSKYIIDELINKKRIDYLILFIAITIFGNLFINVVNSIFNNLLSIKTEELNYEIELYINNKIMNMKYENIENPEILDLKERALFPLLSQGVIPRLTNSISRIVTETFKLIGFIALISSLNIIIICLIIINILLNNILLKKSQKVEYEINKDVIPINRKASIYMPLSFDFFYAKDIRIYDMINIILSKQKAYVSETVKLFRKLFYSIGKYDGLKNINIQFQMIIIYGYISYKVIRNSISIGDLTMYTSAAMAFSSSFSNLISSILEISQMCEYLKSVNEFDKVSTEKTLGGNKNIKDIDNIRFKNVSFKYPFSNEYTLKNISISISKGESLSIVGMNGSGKTTFIKLLARLYEPNEGEILVNGFNINEYNYNDYIKLISVVFQDFKLFAFSIKENVVLDDRKDINDKI